jgi:cystathionine beta-lyase
MTKKTDPSNLHPSTRLARAGRDAARSDGAINPPVHRATTLEIDAVADLYGTPKKTYALQGMAVHEALREALVAVEGGADAVLAPSGLAACTLALLTIARKGGEVLCTDSVYRPTRRFCDNMLKRMGVTTRYYDPHIGNGIAELISDDTCAIFLESPGSLTFEIQDVPAITAAAKARGVPTLIDNTCTAGVYFKPFEHGIDVSIQALTKYQGGHADVFLGATLASTPQWDTRLRNTARDLGLGVSPDDAYLALRGMRSMHVRLDQQSAAGLRLAQWLDARPEIARVLHPALPAFPDHEIWKRDFTGASGCFGFILNPCDEAKLTAMLEGYDVFAMGFSWGGFESLIVPCDPQIMRTAAPWSAEGPLLRISTGLEHPDDLIADLEAGFARLNA